MAAPPRTLTRRDLTVLRGLVQKAGWAEFIFSVSGLMAETADRVPRDSPPDRSLPALSNILNALLPEFTACGRVDFRKYEGLLAFKGEELEILEQYAPPPDAPVGTEPYPWAWWPEPEGIGRDVAP